MKLRPVSENGTMRFPIKTSLEMNLFVVLSGRTSLCYYIWQLWLLYMVTYLSRMGRREKSSGEHVFRGSF